MNLSAVIDIICVYLNSITSFFTTLQNIKNEFHAQPTDYANILLRILSTKTVTPLDIGIPCHITEYGESFLAALVAWVVYDVKHDDWTDSIQEALDGLLLDGSDHWLRGRLQPRTINLQENHYMTSSKAKVYVAVYKPLKTVVLSLPGTNSRSDWLSNLHSTTTELQISGRSVKVHRGFLYIAHCLSTHAEIKSYLSLAKKQGISKLLLCGHSQAGAVVSLLSILLKDYNFDTRVITFGSGATIQAEEMHANRCTSYVRAVYLPQAPINQFWQIDPVPLIDDASLSRTQAESMFPMGSIRLLLDDEQCTEVRALRKGELKQLSNLMLLNFSAAPHSMLGYLAAVKRLVPRQTQDEPFEIEDDVLAMRQLING